MSDPEKELEAALNKTADYPDPEDEGLSLEEYAKKHDFPDWVVERAKELLKQYPDMSPEGALDQAHQRAYPHLM